MRRDGRGLPARAWTPEILGADHFLLFRFIPFTPHVSRRFRNQCPFPHELWPEDWFRRLEPAEIFPDRPEAPVEIDLGFGDGGFFLEMAERFPERNFIGVERLLGRVRKVCRGIEDRGLSRNARTLRLETGYAVEWLLPRNLASRVHLLFPDPWPKKRHHKRRLMGQPAFLRSIHGLLKEDGELIFKTDHPGYFEAVLETLETIDFFERADWTEDDFFYPETDFEKLWLGEGRKIQRLRLVKREEIS